MKSFLTGLGAIRLPNMFCLALVVACAEQPAGEPQPQENEPPVAAPKLTLPPPQRLSDWEAYSDLDTLAFSDAVVEYEPRYPLWTNGSDKQRGISLPAGKYVEWDGASPKFPDESALIKTFSYTTAQGKRQLVETRVLFKLDGKWDYATYQWDSDGKDAELLSGGMTVPVAVNTGEAQFEHTIPSRLNCRTCHESQSTTVLGFSLLQLGAQDQLEALVEAGVFEQAPQAGMAITADSADKQQVLEYFAGNCLHCHNGGSGPASAFSLAPEDAFLNLIDQMTTGELVSGYRVVSGAPDDSGLFKAFSRVDTTGTAQPMPPLGVDLRDDAALELFRKWIEALPITSDTPDLGMGGDSGQ